MIGGMRAPLSRAGSSAALSALVFLVTLAPQSVGASPGTVLTPPYKGTVAYPGWHAFSKCGNATNIVTAAWFHRTGAIKAAESAFIISCPGSGRHLKDADIYSHFFLYIPAPGLSGNGVNITLNLNWTETTQGGAPKSPSCAFAPPLANVSNEACLWEWGWVVTFQAQLYDASNRTWVNQDNDRLTVGNWTQVWTYSNYSYGTYQNSTVQTSCTPYLLESSVIDWTNVCSGNGKLSGQASLWLNNSYTLGGKTYNDTMNASHSYQIQLVFTLQDYAIAITYGPQPGQPVLHGLVGAGFKTNLATNGNSAHLTSIVL